MPEKEKAEPQPAIIEWPELYNPSPDTASLPPWPMVSIRSSENHDDNNPPDVFPPVNHENLHISPDPSFFSKQISYIQVKNLGNPLSDTESDTDSVSNSNSTDTLSPTNWSPSACSLLFPLPKARSAASTSQCIVSWTDIFLSKLNTIVRSLWDNFSSSRGMLLTFRSAAAAAVLIAFLYFRQRRRLRSGQENIDRLVGIVKEKEEKINQLLDQISRMNQMLLRVRRGPDI